MLEQPSLMLKIRRRRFDIFVDLFCNPRTAMLAYASGAGMRIGKEVKWRGRLYTHRILDDGNPKTAVEFHYQYVRPLGVKPAGWRTEIFLREEERMEAGRYLVSAGIDIGRNIVGIHPGATWPAKMWPAERFAELINRITGELGLQVVVTQGPNDSKLAESVAALVPGRAVFLPAGGLRKLAAILSHLSVYVANDSGPMHISVAVGTCTIGIFGPGEDNIWFPYVPPYYDASDRHCALRRDIPCHPCHLDVCNRPDAGYMECMKLLTVEEVFGEVRSRLT
jgi:ADP-heptose:LPS heptosyltransferase